MTSLTGIILQSAVQSIADIFRCLEPAGCAEKFSDDVYDFNEKVGTPEKEL